MMKTEPNRRSDPNGVRTVARAFAVLELLAHPNAELRLTDIAKRLALPLASAHHLLARLAQLEYIAQSSDSRAYRIGPAFVRLAIRGVSAVTLDSAARDIAEALAVEIGEDVYVALAQADGISYLARYQGSEGFTLNAPLGVPRPLHATAVGKLYLAQLPLHQRRQRVAALDLRRYTEHTIVDRDALLAEIAAIEAAGFAANSQETADGVSALAVPIFDGRGTFCGALIVSAPTRRFKDHDQRWLAATRRSAVAIAYRLGAGSDGNQPGDDG